MSNGDIKVGDVVMLKSGGPKMTVSAVGKGVGDEPRAWCDWFEGTKPQSSSFPATSLKQD